MMFSKLTVLIAHGFYHTPAPYKPFVDALGRQGIDAFVPQLATSDLSKLNVGNVNQPDFDREPPRGGYPQGTEDAAIFGKVLRDLIEKDSREVLIVAHSAGGWVATQSAVRDLQLQERRNKGLKGGIVGIMYYGAFVIPKGESISSFFQPKDGSITTPPWLTFHKYGRDGLGTLVEPEKYLLNGVEAKEATKWAKGLTATPVVRTVLTNDPYYSVPLAYVVLEGDLTLPKAYQEGMIAGQEAKSGPFKKKYYSPAGHSAHLTWTDGLVSAVKDFTSGLQSRGAC
ncbi:hypothetical protein BDV95DRAFT_603145 [Massariosphaeria phaeospora]|uniref:AB hydrolase-1 domain-containing protein n=1 Tax=Massariosphaeria phaeospora TaxID=100035 RepID=A0A7C8MAV1_9PLEO|nr:hypothetical protein BDV95DRAFT_603145 [Massariosphaeria phaeospora]